MFYEAEKTVYGASHTDLGYWLAAKWNLPQDLTSAIFYHHSPMEAGEFKTLASIVHAADILARGMCIGSAGDNTIPVFDKGAWDLLELNEEKLKRILSASHEEVEKATIFLKVT